MLAEREVRADLAFLGGSPTIARLDDDQAAAFTAAYRDRLAARYPAGPDGTTLFEFRRIFVVARRPS